MRFEDFVYKILVAFYRESGGDRRDQIAYNTLAIKYGIPVEKPFWIDDCAEKLLQNGWVKTINDRVDEGMIASITLNGIQSAEKMPESILNYPSASSSEIITIPPPSSLIPTSPTVRLSNILKENSLTSDFPQQEPVIYDSTTWTGIAEKIAMNPAIFDNIKIKIKEIDGLIEESGLSNIDTARAKSIINALSILIDSPQPEWNAIYILLTSPALLAVASYISVILSLLGLVK